MEAIKKQKQLIHVNTPTRDMKEEWVQWATGDVKKISCDDLSFEQANKILEQLGIKPLKAEYWAYFDKDNSRHKYVLSLCIQYGWSIRKRGSVFADLDRLNEWMHSNRCPVQKPLKKMSPDELSKFIVALEGMMKSKNK